MTPVVSSISHQRALQLQWWTRMPSFCDIYMALSMDNKGKYAFVTRALGVSVPFSFNVWRLQKTRSDDLSKSIVEQSPLHCLNGPRYFPYESWYASLFMKLEVFVFITVERIIIVITFCQGSYVSDASVWRSVCLLAGLRENYLADLHETRWRGVAWKAQAKTQTLTDSPPCYLLLAKLLDQTGQF